MAGQNPTVDEANKMIADADESGTGLLMYSDMMPIVEKYWRSYENFWDEVKEACLAFGKKYFQFYSFKIK
jgi:Ca2+-binding EF-hand superfamily protein